MQRNDDTGGEGQQPGTADDIAVRDAALMRPAIDALPQPFAYLDLDERHRLINRAYALWFGIDRQAAAGRRFRDVLGDTNHGVVRAHIAAALAGQTISAEHALTLKSGQLRYVSATYSPHREMGRILGAIVTFNDISAQKAAEEAWKATQEQLRSVLATAPDAVITIDQEGEIRSFSPTAERLFGYSSAEVIGQNVKILMPAPYREEHDGHLAQYRVTGQKHIIGVGRQVMAQRKDGQTFPMFLSVDEMLIDGRHMFTGVIHDLTEELSREEELRQAQKMEAIGQLTGGAAHDFNNILTIIMGNLEMLEAKLPDSEPARELLEQALEAADLGAQLTSRMLAFARRQPLEPTAVDINKLVLDVVDLLRRTLGAPVTVETILSTELKMAHADPTQLQNALLNIAINARDAMPDGGHLTIETEMAELDSDYARSRPDAQAGHYILLSVSDNGTGMSPETQMRAIEPFFTTKDVGSGSGLGLSMVYGFTKQSGGHLRIYSEVGIGTTISLYLPLAEEKLRPDDAAAARPEEYAGRGEMVLVVEDDERVRAVTVLRLKDLGYDVLEAEDGLAAMEILRQSHSIDLLFTDVVMPGGLLGEELVDLARTLRPGIKVLLTSGYTESAGTQSGVLAGGAPWLRKPYRKEELARKIRDVLDAR